MECDLTEFTVMFRLVKKPRDGFRERKISQSQSLEYIRTCCRAVTGDKDRVFAIGETFTDKEGNLYCIREC